MATSNVLNIFRNIETKMKAEYQCDANAKYLVLRIRKSGLKKLINVEIVGKYACDHDHWTSDCGRCWDCGTKLKQPKPSLIYDDIDFSSVPKKILNHPYYQKCIELALKSKSEVQKCGAIIVSNGVIIGEGWNRLLGRNEPFPFRTSFFLHGEKAAMGDAILRYGQEKLKGATLYVACVFVKEIKALILKPSAKNTCTICTQHYPRFGLRAAFPRESGWVFTSGEQAYQNALESRKIIQAQKVSNKDYRLSISL